VGCEDSDGGDGGGDLLNGVGGEDGLTVPVGFIVGLFDPGS